MIALTLAEVAALTSGRPGGGADGAAVVTAGVVTDSRQVTPGCLFVALPGSRVDGHDHAGEALAAGAVAVLAARDVGGPAVLVDDPLLALGRLARGVVDRIEGLVVVGITGSSGKTSTKDLVAAVLAQAGPTVATAGSFNNELGLPLTALRCDAGTRYLVVEMGARMPGNISYLAGITPPRIAVELNVGAAHAGVFGSLEVTAATKAELVAALPAGGVAVLNADDARVRAMPVPAGARTVRFAVAGPTGAEPTERGATEQGPTAEVVARDVRLDDAARPSFRLVTPVGEADVSLRLHGAHHVGNALAAAAVGLAAGLDVAGIARSLGEAGAASRWRMEVTTRADGVTVVNDAYNANPESMRAALDALAVMTGEGTGRRGWAVLGEMLELGDDALAAHEALGALVAAHGVARLVAVGGEAAAAIVAGATAGAIGATATRPAPGTTPGVVTQAADRDAALALLRAQVRPGDVVLVKASRSVGLDVLAAGLLGDDRLASGNDPGVPVRRPDPPTGQDGARGLVTGEARL